MDQSIRTRLQKYADQGFTIYEDPVSGAVLVRDGENIVDRFDMNDMKDSLDAATTVDPDDDDVSDAVSYATNVEYGQPGGGLPAAIRDLGADAKRDALATIADAVGTRAKTRTPVDTGSRPGDGVPFPILHDDFTLDVENNLDTSGAQTNKTRDTRGENTVTPKPPTDDTTGPIWTRWDASPWTADDLAAELKGTRSALDVYVRYDQIPDEIRDVFVTTKKNVHWLRLHDTADDPHWSSDFRLDREGQELDMIKSSLVISRSASSDFGTMFDALLDETVLITLGSVVPRFVSDTPTDPDLSKALWTLNEYEEEERLNDIIDSGDGASKLDTGDLFDQLDQGYHVHPLPKANMDRLTRDLSAALSPISRMLSDYRKAMEDLSDAIATSAPRGSYALDAHSRDDPNTVTLSNGSTIKIPDDVADRRLQIDTGARGNWVVRVEEKNGHGWKTVEEHPISESEAKVQGTGILSANAGP